MSCGTSFASLSYVTRWTALSSSTSFTSLPYVARWTALSSSTSFASLPYVARWTALSCSTSFTSLSNVARWTALSCGTSFASSSNVARWTALSCSTCRSCDDGWRCLRDEVNVETGFDDFCAACGGEVYPLCVSERACFSDDEVVVLDAGVYPAVSLCCDADSDGVDEEPLDIVEFVVVSAFGDG